MSLEEKVAICVKEYGNIAEGQLKKKRNNKNWKSITDGQLFCRSIFCSVPVGEEWKPEDYPVISEMLESIWEADTEENHYIIEQTFPTLKGAVDKEAVYLKLAYIALLGDKTKKNFIKAIMDISYYKKSGIWAKEEVLDDLWKEVGSDWGEQLRSIFKAHFGDKHSGMVFVDEIFRNHVYYIKNARNRNTLTDFFDDKD